MFYYSRQIVYLDLLEAGHKVGNAGFLKLEETDGGLRWRIQIKGLRETDHGFFEIRDETGVLVDKMLLERGAGRYFREFDGRMERGGRACGEICGLRIGLAGNRAVEGRWKRDCGRGTVTGRAARALEAAEYGQPGKVASEEALERKETAGAQDRSAERKEAAGVDRPAERKEAAGAGRPAERKEAAGAGRPTERKEKACPDCPGKSSPGQPASTSGGETLYEDKWQQLQHIYPTVHPFRDQREYLSIAPKDFVVLSMEYQKMVHNSFLLHGYYNYRHIILGRFTINGEVLFYLGVPGVYYDREKMVAEMFGFEAFEGRTSPAEPGSFGYYMKRVKI